jgi:hypothetical protein
VECRFRLLETDPVRMRILFLCPSLEPGRDGVGDYTLRLAGELRARGHGCLALAINDRHLRGGGCSTDRSWLAAEEGPAIRLAAADDWQERTTAIQRVVSEFRPDWVSLQYVPWGFGHRGLHWGLGRSLQAAVQGKPLHVMCHELWLDATFPLPWRQRLLGFVQKSGIERLLRQLRPRIVQTHIPHYRQMLGTLGVPASLLPLHGNIPVLGTRAEGRSWLATRCGIGLEDHVAGFFGNLWQTLDVELLKKVLAGLPVASGECFVLSAGELAPSGEANWKIITKEIGGICRLIRLGPLRTAEASAFLSSLDFGLTSYPGLLAGKSGAVAAMLEHGVAVGTAGLLRRHEPQSDHIRPEDGATVAGTADALLRILNAGGSTPLSR